MAEHQQRPGFMPEKGPSTSQVLAVITLFPVGGILLVISGLTLAGTLIGLTVATPLFVIFSPILVPAALVLALAITGFLTSGAFGITALSSLSWIVNYLRKGRVTEQMEHARWRVQEGAGQLGMKAKEVGHGIQGKAQETTRTWIIRLEA